MDEREHPRYEVDAYIDYSGEDVLRYHGIQNISLGGICIHTPAVEPIGSRVEVVITFPELGAKLALTGEVVWANQGEPRDLGIRWLDLGAGQKQRLREYLRAVTARRVEPPPAS
jgi:Tfp pilus assembly protein PilZ